MNKDLTVNLTGEQKEIVLRTGNALEPRAPKAINITGTLPAPSQFKAGKELDPKGCHLQINFANGTIELHVQDTDPYTEHVIKGALTSNVDLKKFKINDTAHRWSVAEFLQFIKPLKFFFADRSLHQKLVLALQKWSVKVEKIINEHNDNKGNTNYQLMTTVNNSAMGEDGFPQKFDLLIPIFQGYPNVQFTVEIGLDPNNATVKLFLMSDQLVELEAGFKEKLLAEELAKFEDFPCSKIVLA